DPHIIKHDQYLFQHADIKALDFDVVLQVGGRLIAKPVEELLKNRRGIHIFVDDHHKRSDPGLSVTHRLDGDIELFARELTTLLAKKPSLLLPIWLSLADKFDSIITDLIKEGDKATEPFVAHHISQVIDKQCMLMACTSMPIRDYHFFARYRDDGGPKIVVNRGTSGIDGLISTAIGFSHASKKRCTVLIGDLAFMHDANALALLQQLSVPMCIVAINNQGGAIFSFLPVAKFPHILTPFIDTPHDHDLAYFAKVFHIKHCLAITKTEFIDSYKEAKKAGHHIIIEVRSDKESNFLLHERIKKALLSLEGLPPVCR
ncbi:MAG TPA: thiamine pyrophosphate-dependent enzyme, partial [Myxococcota bacterium]|nr:thiamine pyrophosphate-dependent enzyme [Myxococcota bacterium]